MWLMQLDGVLIWGLRDQVLVLALSFIHHSTNNYCNLAVCQALHLALVIQSSKTYAYLKDLTFQRKTIRKCDNCCDRKEGTNSLLRNEERRGRGEEEAYHS